MLTETQTPAPTDALFFALVDLYRALRAQLAAVLDLACESGDDGDEHTAAVADRTADALELRIAAVDAEIRVITGIAA